ncbi:GAF domain-containing protein [Psychromonas sp. KJ10-10]|uniref:GAF domain-containing protein n=1 Tax=Psychromonas sp. KJ10-10 TaxID=3391823 RepID=UPI0039B546DF
MLQTKLAMQVDCCSIYITDDQTQQLNLMASEGLINNRQTQQFLKYGEGVVGLIHQKGEPLNLANISEHSHYKYLPGSQEDNFKSLLGTPIIHQRQVLGVLVAQQKTPRLFNELEESFLVTLAMHLASLLGNTGLRLQLGAYFQPTNVVSLQGAPASSGIAIAPAFVVKTNLTLEEVKITTTQSTSKEIELFDRMVEKCSNEFSGMALTLKEQLSKDAFALFDIYSHILNDKAFINAIYAKINQEQLNARQRYQSGSRWLYCSV